MIVNPSRDSIMSLSCSVVRPPVLFIVIIKNNQKRKKKKREKEKEKEKTRLCCPRVQSRASAGRLLALFPSSDPCCHKRMHKECKVCASIKCRRRDL